MTKSPAETTILITGATSGIGRHAAVYLAELGYRVFAAGRNRQALDALRQPGRANLTPLALDVTDAESIERARQAIDEDTAGHGVDVLINNAGYGDFAPLELVSDAELRRLFDTNVFGLMAITRAFLPAMRARGAGRIINVSSVGGRVTMPLLGAYNATKYAVESLSDALRLELHPFGIQVSLIEPGPIQTEFATSALERADRRSAEPTPYAPVIARYLELTRRADKMAPGPVVTSRAIHAAIKSGSPRARYVVPFWTGRVFTIGILARLPTFLADVLIRRVVGLTPRVIAQARPTPELDGQRA